MNWVEVAADLKFNQNISWAKMPEELAKLFPGETWEREKIRAALRRCPEYRTKEIPNENIDLKSELLELLQKEQNKKSLCDTFNISVRVLDAVINDLEEEGYQFTRDTERIKLCKQLVPQDNVFSEDWQGNKIIRFGGVSDPHLCSKWQQLTHLNTLYDIFQQEGIETVYNAGDISEGYKMRPGHEFEVFKHGADEQTEYIIENYPQRKGVITKFITGNHDHSHIKNGGHDIGKTIARERPDMVYMGQSNAKIELTPNCILEVDHPLDGSAYALSYAVQKRIDSMSGGEKPSVLLEGHHHKMIKLFYRNIHAFEMGTSQAQTPWMRGKRLPAHIGGWIIELRVDDEGTIRRCITEWIPFYKAIQNDY